ncbi:MAG: S41 family peptidase [Bacteroidota bacterium]
MSSLSLFAQPTDKFFAKQEVLADLSYLYESLQDAHYNAFAYTSEEEFLAAYQRVRASVVQDSMSHLEVINTFQQLIATIKNGHTEIDFPIASYMNYATSGGTLFPLEIAFEEGRPLVRKNFSAAKEIASGAEVLSINGMPIQEVLNRIYPHISAERLYFKQAKLELISFPRYYWQVFGQQDSFSVQIRQGGIIHTYTFPAVNLVTGYEYKRDEVLNAKMEVKFFESAAYLNPGNLSGDEPAFQAFIDSAFAVILESGKPNLIIDLRNNRGGDDTFSDYVVSFIADKPFKWISSLSIRSSKFLKAHIRANRDTTNEYNRLLLSKADGAVFPYEFEPYSPQPEQNRFQGKVYVLVNRQSHSQSAVMAAQVQDYGFGTIVGEETGDYPSLYASQFQYTLPKTGVVVKVSKGYMVRVNGSKKPEGVIPDLMVKDYLLDEQDEILDDLLKKL